MRFSPVIITDLGDPTSRLLSQLSNRLNLYFQQIVIGIHVSQALCSVLGIQWSTKHVQSLSTGTLRPSRALGGVG